MANVTPDIRQEIDYLLDSLSAAWSALPEVAAEFDSWDAHEQVDFIEEWPLNAYLLRRLQEYMDEEPPTQGQRERYQALLGLVEKNQPYLCRIIDE